MLRLIMIRQVRQEAEDNSKLNTDLGNMLAILQIDFCIESLLKLIVFEKGGANSYPGMQSDYFTLQRELQPHPFTDNWKFPRLYDEVIGITQDASKVVTVQPPSSLRSQVQNIHNMRNDIQHSGLIPSQASVVSAITDGTNFLEQLLKNVFGLTLLQIRLSEVILDPDVKSEYVTAEDELSKGNYKESIERASVAFTKARQIMFGRFPRFSLGLSLTEDFEEFRRIRDAITSLEQDLLLLRFGINALQYQQYLLSTPVVHLTANFDTEWIQGGASISPSQTSANFVLGFVFDTLSLWHI